MKKMILLSTAVLLTGLTSRAQDLEPMKDNQKPPFIPAAEQNVRDNVTAWQQLKFGMFIHWGPYSQWGIVESWSLSPEAYKFCMVRPDGMSYFEYKKKYEGLKNTFNPQQFDPSKWAETAQHAGMKYVVFTTKHHDGFNMYDTKYSDYKVTDPECPFNTNPRSDIAKEIFNAFRARGLYAGAYFSIADWNHPDYWWDYFPPKDRHINYSSKTYPERWERLNTFIDNQLDELTRNYGPLMMLWFDLCGSSPEEPHPWERFAKTARTNQPGIMMVARHMNTIYENYRTPEQRVPAEPHDYPWESCMTMANQWSWKADDQYKSAHNIINILVQTVSRGGNLLLNVGPGPHGELHPTAYERLREIGDWMDVNSEGIYGTKAIAPYKEDRIVFTSKNHDVYAFWLADEGQQKMPATITVKSFTPASAAAVHLLGYKTPLKWKRSDKGTVIEIPVALQNTPPCKFVWTFKIATK